MLARVSEWLSNVNATSPTSGEPQVLRLQRRHVAAAVSVANRGAGCRALSEDHVEQGEEGVVRPQVRHPESLARRSRSFRVRPSIVSVSARKARPANAKPAAADLSVHRTAALTPRYPGDARHEPRCLVAR
jgi:hypothetical protein